MTTNPTPIPEPTSPTAVVVGKRNGDTVLAVRVDNAVVPWMLRADNGCGALCNWRELCRDLTDIRVVPEADLAAKPEPGPWLRGDELKAVIHTLKAGDVVEVDHDGHKATGELWPEGLGRLVMWALTVRTSKGEPGLHVDALRIIERAPEPEPEPGADIPDEVIEAACRAIGVSNPDSVDFAHMRAALAAADAKRAELEGGVA